MYKIVYENDNFLIISKEVNVEFHGSGQLLDKLREDFTSIHGIHRLDKATSGLMVFAKTKAVQSEISKLFEEKKVSKAYVALSKHKPTKKQGIVKGALEKGRNGSYKLTRSMENASYTRFSSTFDLKSNIRVFNLIPKTGKTHQLRVVMKSLGTPILGDTRYKGDIADRMYLHSYMMEFALAGENYKFEDFDFKGDYFKDSDFSQLVKEYLIGKMV